MKATADHVKEELASESLEDDVALAGGSGSGSNSTQAARAAQARARTGFSHLPEDLDLRSVQVGLGIAGGTILHRESSTHSLSTAADTMATFVATSEALRLNFEPPLALDVTYPGEDLFVHSVTYDLESHQLGVALTKDPSTNGFVDVREDVRLALADAIGAAFSGSAAGQPGYDPLSDKDIELTLGRIVHNIQSGSKPGSYSEEDEYATPETELGLDTLDNPTMGATFQVLGDSQVADGDRVLRIAGGSSLTLSLRDRVSLKKRAQEGGSKGLELIVSSDDALALYIGGSLAYHLRKLLVRPGGAVEILELEASDDAALDPYNPDKNISTEPRSLAQITGAEIQGQVRRGLAAVAAEYRHSLPGIDLVEYLGF